MKTPATNLMPNPVCMQTRACLNSMKRVIKRARVLMTRMNVRSRAGQARAGIFGRSGPHATLYTIALIMVLTLSLLLLGSIPARPATLTVDPAVSVLLSYSNLDDYAALTGRDPARIIALWVARADTFQIFARSAADYRAALAGGAWAIRGSATGGTAYGRVYDGVTDYDVLGSAADDSSEMRDGVLYEILFRSTSSSAGMMLSTGNVHGIYFDDGRIRPRINGTYVLTAGSSGAYSEGQWHLARVFITADSAMVAVDGVAPVYAAHAQPLTDASYGTAFGARPTGISPFGGAIQSIAILDYSGMNPHETDVDGCWAQLAPFLDGSSQTFAAPQAALDYAYANLAGDAAIDTVRLLPGVYLQPVNIALDQIMLQGFLRPDRVILDGSALPSGTALLTVSAASEVTVRRLTLRDGPTAIRSRDGSRATVRNCVIAGNNVAVESNNNAVADTLKLNRCTLDGNKYGLYIKTPDSGRVRVTNSCITATWTQVIVGSPPAGTIIVSGLLVWDNATVLPGSHLAAAPLYANRTAGAFWLLGGSPAINRGNPAYGYDEDGSLPDIGAYARSCADDFAVNWTRPGWFRNRWSR